MIKFALYLIAFWVFAPMVLVAIGLPFAIEKKSFKAFTQHTNPDLIKRNIDLPSWLKWLQNSEDGLTGDDRGWYWNTYWPAWTPSWFKMWWWSGWRNPWNYLKRFVTGIDIRQFTFHKLTGDDYVRDDLSNQGFQILYAKPVNGWFPRPMLYWVREWGDSGRGICIQLGWKIKLEHNSEVYDDEWDYWKGFTFEPNPYKDLS